MTTHRAWSLTLAGAWLLYLSCLVPASALATEFVVRYSNGLFDLTARDAPIADIIDAVAEHSGMQVVDHLPVSGTITLESSEESLHSIVSQLLVDHSYQLYVAPPAGRIPTTLWIFADGASQADVAPLFLESVLYDGNRREKIEAIRELRRMGTNAAVGSLSIAINDSDAIVQERAIEALESIGSDEALTAVASASLDDDPWVREQAVSALASGRSDTAIQYLRLAMRDSDSRVRAAVVESLADTAFGDVPSPVATELITTALQDDDAGVRMVAMEALEEIGGPTAMHSLHQIRDAQRSEQRTGE